MNMQAMLRQAQKMQKDMQKTQEEINKTEFVGKSELVSVKMMGDRNVTELKIDGDELEKDDIEVLEDMVLIAVNDALKQIDKVTETKMGAYTKGMPGLF